MLCRECQQAEVVEGTLEAVSFEPTSQCKKFFTRGVYGLKAVACPNCGSVYGIHLDEKELRKIIKVKS